MTKNTDNYDNIDLIRYLNHLILKEAENAITEGLPLDNKLTPGAKIADDKEARAKWSADEYDRWGKRNIILNRLMRMFGKDRPVVDVLGDVADTELKIEKQRPGNGAAENSAPQLDEKDLSLVKHYLHRHKPE